MISIAITNYLKTHFKDIMHPKISIITVCYNCKDDIEPTILSVLGQTYQNVEYIVIDGGSTDGTLEIIAKYRDKINVLVSEPDGGIFDAMNKGLKYATGIWINFMNAGDIFIGSETVKSIFQNKNHNKIGVIYGSTVTNEKISYPEAQSSLKYGGIMACHQSIFYNREVCRSELYYKTKHKYYGDIELTRRLYLKKIPFKKVPVIIANYKGGGFSSVISSAARRAKFDYLYQNLGLLGLWSGVVGKLKYIKLKLFS